MATPETNKSLMQTLSPTAGPTAEEENFDPDYEVLVGEDPDADKPAVEYVTVLHGYGRVAPTKKNYLDGYEFVGGVGKNIPSTIAAKWAKLPGFRVHILPAESTPMEWAKKAGIRPMDPNKLAAFIAASDLDTLVQTLGRQRAMELVEALSNRVAKIGVRKAAGSK